MMFASPIVASEVKQSPTDLVEIASARQPRLTIPPPRILASITILAAVVFITYQSALRLNFYGDDYSFVEIAGRSSLAQYLAFYFDPRLQTGWYRPMQGMVFGIEWVLFGGNPIGYHLVNVLVHLANCILLFTLVNRVARRWHIAFFSALIYAGLPLYGVAVFWPGDADFLLTFFYLLTLLCWILYLQHATFRLFILSFVFFLLTLLTKEFGVTLPIILFLADRLMLSKPVVASGTEQSPPYNWEIASSRKPLLAMTFPALLRRYAPFLIVYIFYLPLEYYIQSRSVLTQTYGYRIADHVISNFIQYLAWLTFPWGLPEPLNYIWLAIALLLYGYLLLTKKSAPLLFLGVAGVLAFLPVTPFPWFFTRYLYLAVMPTAIVLGYLADWIRTRRAPWLAFAASGLLALIVLGNSLGVTRAVADFAELGRQTRVPFRDISQHYAGFPDDTYLYFINPPTITSQLSGMFFLRYGAGVHVASDEYANRHASLREHAHAYVVYFDEQRRTRIMPVEKNSALETQPAPPLDFAAAIRLDDFELASANVTRDQALVVMLYWRGINPIADDYVVIVQLVDAKAQIIAQSNQVPRHGTAPTHTWTPGALVVDAIQLDLTKNLVPGTYRLEIGLSDAATQQRVAIVDARGTSRTDRVVIAPVRIVE